jgi:hypothetical protein
VRISSTADLPDSVLTRGTVILVGTAEGNPLIGADAAGAGEHGLVRLRGGGRGARELLLTGADPKAVEAAAVDFVLRYWKNAKDAAIRVTGMEQGAALGNRAGVGVVNPP